jgi:hypothetical protein
MYPDDIPIIIASPGDLEDELVKLNDNRASLQDIGVRSREYALKYHHPVNVAKRIEEYI